jgi:hypothetical protein
MFNKREMVKYEQLSQDEAEALSDFKTILTSGNEMDLQLMSELLKTYGPKIIFKMSAKHTPFKEFCQKNSLHQSAWIENLQACRYPGYDIESHNEGKKCTTYDQYVGSYHFNQYKEFKDAQPTLAKFQLDQACKHRILFALVERCELNISKIQSEETAKPEKEILKNKIESDIEILCRQYWSIGCACASKIYFDLGKYYDEHPDKSSEEGEATIGYNYYLKGVDRFILAELLYEHNTSLQMIHFLVKNNNFFEYVYKIPFKDWQDTKEKYILKFVNDDLNLYKKFQETYQSKTNSASSSPI